MKLLTPSELESLPDPTWLIDGILPANSLCVLYGEPGCGKTFVSLSIALSLASGQSWCGKRASPAKVLYVAAEGLFGLKFRVRAHQAKYNSIASSIRYLGETFSLLKPTDMEAVTTSLQSFQPDLIVLDTFARLVAGADENSAKDVGAAIKAIDEFRSGTKATVLLIHHTGKNSKAERGSSALRGAADVMIECARIDGDLVQLRCDKMKDAEPFKTGLIGFTKVEIGSRSSLAVTDWRAAIQEASSRSQAQLKALKVLQSQFTSGASHSEWENAFKEVEKKSSSTFARALRELKVSGAVVERDDKYFAVEVGVTVK